jgi:hypothetical protein
MMKTSPAFQISLELQPLPPGCRFRSLFKPKNVPYFVPYELQHMVHMVQLDTYSPRM